MAFDAEMPGGSPDNRELGNGVRWDLFCSVVDNFGDIGFCWRLARQLSNEFQQTVRLWVDDLDRLASFCPGISTTAERQFAGSMEVCRWSSDPMTVDVGEVVIEAFACHLPPSCIESMLRREQPPVWINLEYLSAEDWVEGCHLLPSPQSRSSLKKTFFFPGFTVGTGGLLRERQLLNDRSQFDSAAAAMFWQKLGWDELAATSARASESSACTELRVSLFCYENPMLQELLECWSQSATPVRLFATVGHATKQVGDWFGEALAPGKRLQRERLSVYGLPFLTQDDYDRLLWSCDLNLVRGEDSFVRAQWAQRPFVWQIYPQSGDAHLVKLEAFLKRYLRQFGHPDVARRCWLAWNGVHSVGFSWESFRSILTELEQHGKVWARELDQVGNLADNLVRFVRGN